jgi:hypothetical protein
VPDELSPAEERLLGLLLLLRAETRRGDAPPTELVMRAVRWQSMVRGAARALGSVVGAVADGIVLFLGLRSGRGRR